MPGSFNRGNSGTRITQPERHDAALRERIRDFAVDQQRGRLKLPQQLPNSRCQRAENLRFPFWRPRQIDLAVFTRCQTFRVTSYYCIGPMCEQLFTLEIFIGGFGAVPTPATAQRSFDERMSCFSSPSMKQSKG